MAGFNAQKFAEENPMDMSLPLGHYKVICENVEGKTSSTGFEMLTFKIRIMDTLTGSFINALNWENLVIGHDSQQTQEIAFKKLTEIMLSAGVQSYGNVEELNQLMIGKPFTMSMEQAKSGRVYARYRPISYFEQFSKTERPAQTKVIKSEGALAPAPSIDDYEDDIPF